MGKKYVMMWVDPKFKKKIKMEALDHEMRIIDYTRSLGEDSDDIYNRLKSSRNRRDYDFKL